MFKRKMLGMILVGVLIFNIIGVVAPSMEKKNEKFNVENKEIYKDGNEKLAIKSNSKASFIEDGETDYWGVFIGIGDYKGNHDLPLNETCVYDALLPAKNWDKSHMKLLVNENANRSAILDALDWLKENAKSDDIVLFSYQGHGYELAGNPGIVPWEGLDGFISVDELDEKFDEIDAKGMCLIFDCCLSGSFVEKKGMNIMAPNEARKFIEVFKKGIEGNNRVIIMSTMKGGLGASIEIHNFVTNTTRVITFSNWIAQAFRKAIDYNRDSICSAEEAFLFAKIRILPFAILLLNPVWQLKLILVTGHPLLAFPQIYDGYKGELPIVLK